MLLEAFASNLDIAHKDFSQLLVQMRASKDAQPGDLLRVGRHRISRQDPSSLPHFVKDVEFVRTPRAKDFEKRNRFPEANSQSP